MNPIILLVEDNKLVLRSIRAMLEAAGWEVDACEDGLTALAKVESSALYDLLLLDNDLPGANGIEIIEVARRLPHRQRTPIVMCSGGSSQAEALHAGADVFLRKPDELRAVVATIEHLLNKLDTF